MILIEPLFFNMLHLFVDISNAEMGLEEDRIPCKEFNTI